MGYYNSVNDAGSAARHLIGIVVRVPAKKVESDGQG